MRPGRGGTRDTGPAILSDSQVRGSGAKRSPPRGRRRGRLSAHPWCGGLSLSCRSAQQRSHPSQYRAVPEPEPSPGACAPGCPHTPHTVESLSGTGTSVRQVGTGLAASGRPWPSSTAGCYPVRRRAMGVW